MVRLGGVAVRDAARGSLPGVRARDEGDHSVTQTSEPPKPLSLGMHTILSSKPLVLSSYVHESLLEKRERKLIGSHSGCCVWKTPVYMFRFTVQ